MDISKYLFVPGPTTTQLVISVLKFVKVSSVTERLRLSRGGRSLQAKVGLDSKLGKGVAWVVEMNPCVSDQPAKAYGLLKLIDVSSRRYKIEFA